MTSFYLTVRNVKDNDAFEKLNNVLKEFDLIRYVFDDGNYFEEYKEAMFCPWEEETWKNGNGQMIIISERFPEMTFELTCHSNSYDTFWRVYYKDGMTETCDGEVIYEAPRKIKWSKAI